MSEKYLIFGATGSIGSSLADQLKNSGYDIHLVARNEEEVKIIYVICVFKYNSFLIRSYICTTCFVRVRYNIKKKVFFLLVAHRSLSDNDESALSVLSASSVSLSGEDQANNEVAEISTEVCTSSMFFWSSLVQSPPQT